MTNLSYCKFTDKQEAILNTGGTTGSPGTGAGLIVWYPRVTEGPSLFYYKADNSTSKLPEDTTGIPFSGSSGNTLDPAKWRLGFAKSYADNFSSGVLVAASLSI